ncbi:hypothetical protein FIU99_26870 (plasmid) [Vibrio sp. THAF64]|nr:hypothetical protein FIU99_26870 [Vibrio sp. THAF64]
MNVFLGDASHHILGRERVEVVVKTLILFQSSDHIKSRIVSGRRARPVLIAVTDVRLWRRWQYQHPVSRSQVGVVIAIPNPFANIDRLRLVLDHTRHVAGPEKVIDATRACFTMARSIEVLAIKMDTALTQIHFGDHRAILRFQRMIRHTTVERFVNRLIPPSAIRLIDSIKITTHGLGIFGHLTKRFC